MPTPEITVTHERTCTLSYDPETLRSLIRADAVAKSGIPDSERLSVKIDFSSDNGIAAIGEEQWPMKIRAVVTLCEDLTKESTDGSE